MYKALFIAALSLFFTLLVAANKPALAADCTVIYGGGEIKCDNSVTPTSQTSPTPPTNQKQTKGGLTVQKPTNATKTPATGPELLGLVSLVPMAAAGFYLRKKA